MTMINTNPTLDQISEHIGDRLANKAPELKEQWECSTPVKHLVVDDLLPDDWAISIANLFPKASQLPRNESLKESKSIGVDMDNYAPQLKAITFALQSTRILQIVSQITSIPSLNPDKNLYSGGLSMMQDKDFLNPHIDNSGNPFLKQYRRINALYYVTPDWNPQWGGNLELWDSRRANPIKVESLFNRLVLMNTNRTSFHSVSPIHDCGKNSRKCVSNYYFSPKSPEPYEYFHVTSFRGRPEQSWIDSWLRMDAWVRGLYRKIRPRTEKSIKHVFGAKK
jgi:Rps23 Pro-64 3,4-dihydroxylase Tpa1-like proline 4-hydroxylase